MFLFQVFSSLQPSKSQYIVLYLYAYYSYEGSVHVCLRFQECIVLGFEMYMYVEWRFFCHWHVSCTRIIRAHKVFFTVDS